MKTPVQIERSGRSISTDAYILVKDIHMTEVEAKHLYSIKNTQEDLLNTVIIHDSNERLKKKAIKAFSVAHTEEFQKPRDMTAVLNKHKNRLKRKDRDVD